MTEGGDEREQAREHLASERTALAWIRTGVTLAALGFAVARFGEFLRRDGEGDGSTSGAIALGIALVVAGCSAAIAGEVRHLRARGEIRRGAFHAELWPETALTAVLLALGAGVAAYIATSP